MTVYIVFCPNIFDFGH